MTSRTSSSQMWEDSEHARDRDRDRERDRDRDRNHDRRDKGDRTNTPNDRPSRNRSRSPRRERGGRRGGDTRFRSRSPFRRKERDRDGPRSDRDRDSRDSRPSREPPQGPRGSGGGSYRDRNSQPYKNGGPVKPTPAPKAETSDEEDSKDVKMDGLADAERPEGIDEDTWEMMKVMGFGRFKSTKDTKVPGNDKNYGVRRDKKMEARQYMNRQGGFNRPLSPG